MLLAAILSPMGSGSTMDDCEDRAYKFLREARVELLAQRPGGVFRQLGFIVAPVTIPQELGGGSNVYLLFSADLVG